MSSTLSEAGLLSSMLEGLLSSMLEGLLSSMLEGLLSSMLEGLLSSMFVEVLHPPLGDSAVRSSIQRGHHADR